MQKMSIERVERMRAYNFLFRNGLMILKEQGIQWLDLGVNDEDNTPGINGIEFGVNRERHIIMI